MQGTWASVSRPLRQAGAGLIRYCRHRTASVFPRPVIFGGSPKSGTTAIAALLAEATGLSISNDPFWRVLRSDGDGFLLPDVLEGNLRLDAFVRKYPAYFSAQIVKDPDFAFLYRELQQVFPESPQVFIVRDPRENIRSILDRLHMRGDLERLGPAENRTLAREGGWRAILDGRGLGLDGRANYIGRLAQRWTRGVDAYFAAGTPVHLVRYEDFLEDRAAFIADLAELLGLQLRTDVSERLARRPGHHGYRSLSTETFFGKRNLSIIERTCGAHMAKFGYA
jgi:hypothetical protein